MSHSARASIGAIRNNALKIFQTGISAADPYLAVKNCLIADEGHVKIQSNSAARTQHRTGSWSKIHLIAFGKAACLMAKAAREAVPETLLDAHGIAVTNYENVTSIPGIEVIGAGHPLPDESGFKAAQRITDMAISAKKNELVLVLISGGGSALIPYPVDGISLSDKSAATDLLLASGATIHQINCVRKHLSRIKGGGLARMTFPADCHALILSDVLDDDLSVIASGPTFPDTTTFADAVAVVNDKHLWDKIPATIQRYLELGLNGLAPETPKPDEKVFENVDWTLIGSNRISLNRTLQAAHNLGYIATIYDDRLCGIAKDVAEELVIAAKSHIDKQLSSGVSLNRPIALLAGGETTVILKGNGRGGRNQEMALAFALAAEKHQLSGQWVFLSGGTDGRDGPTDAAGGMVDSDSIKRMRSSGINPVELLDNNDSYSALETSQDLLNTGATGTNVADLQVLLIHSQN